MGGQVVATRSAGAMAGHVARVAARLFAARGYDATSVREIVGAAGVTKPTLYYHFGSKEGLAQALLTVPMTAFVARLRGCLGATGDPLADLSAQFAAHLDFIAEDPDRGRFYYALHFGPLGSGLAGELAEFARQIDAALREGVERVVGAGFVEPIRAGRFATACWGSILVHSLALLDLTGECAPEATAGDVSSRARDILSDLLNGFAAPTPPDPTGEGA